MCHVLTLALAFCAGAAAQQNPRRLITLCRKDVLGFDLGAGTIERTVPGPDGISVQFDKGDFSIRRGTRIIYAFQVSDFSTNGEMLWSPDGQAFALNYSNGGAIGNFHVRVFSKRGDTITEVSSAIRPAVDDFKARHYCKSRGNNVRALKWLEDSKRLVLMTDVYPTGDCGSDLGHTEGYVIRIPDGKIERHLTLNQLKTFPGICLENDDGQ